MSIRKLYRKVRLYNEIADVMGTERITMEIRIQDIHDNVKVFSFEDSTYKIVKKTIMDEYTEVFTRKLIANSKLTFRKNVKIDGNTISVWVHPISQNSPS